MKKCSRCKKEKELDKFTNSKRSKDGKWCYCKECVSEIGKIERKKNPEKFRQKSKNYRENNPDKYREICKKNYENNKEVKKQRQRNYYWKNHEVVMKRANERSKTDDFRQKAKEYREKNKEWIKKQRECHLMIQYAIKLGVLKKSLYCEECGLGDCLIDGHHENYDEPLKIKWVCRKCHRKLEKIGN